MKNELTETAEILHEWADADAPLPPASVRMCADLMTRASWEISGLRAALRDVQEGRRLDPPRLTYREPGPVVARVRDRVLTERGQA